LKKFLILALAVILALGMTGGVFAYFTDVETSSGNSFTAGTLDLEIRDNGTWDPDPWGNGVDMTWVMDNMVPGGSSVTNHVFLRNVGSIAGNHVEISFSNAIDEATNPVETDSNPASLPQDLAKWIEVGGMSYAISDLKYIITHTTGWDVNGNGWLDLDDLARSPIIIAEHGPLDDLVPPDSVGGEASFSLSLYFRTEATNDIQGDILITTVSFTLNQDNSQ
jgi:predicted ribosomally synthesized peptide with SipW-like signal peptide